jgi:hypothetical protein
MPRSLKRAIASMALLLVYGGGTCPCGTTGAAEEAPRGRLEAAEARHCAVEADGRTGTGQREGPCDSRTCRHCRPELVTLPDGASAGPPIPGPVAARGDLSVTLYPALPAARTACTAGEPSPPAVSHSILKLKCCFLI